MSDSFTREFFILDNKYLPNFSANINWAYWLEFSKDLYCGYFWLNPFLSNSRIFFALPILLRVSPKSIRSKLSLVYVIATLCRLPTKFMSLTFIFSVDKPFVCVSHELMTTEINSNINPKIFFIAFKSLYV